MSDTGPREIAKRIAEEVSATLDRVRDDDTFKRELIVGITEVRVRQEALAREMIDHREDDRRQFTELAHKVGAVTQNVGNSRSQIDKGVGILVGVVALLGLVMWIVDRVSPQ